MEPSLEELQEFLIKDNWYYQYKKIDKQELIALLFNKTDFLPEKIKLAQRRWHVINGIYEIPKCKQCNNIVKWYGSKYNTYCSIFCSAHDPYIISKFKESINYKYHVLKEKRKPFKQDYKNYIPNIKKDEYFKLKNISSEYTIINKKYTNNLHYTNPQTYVNLLLVTDFLDVNSTVKQRLWHIDNDYMEKNICKNCNINEIPWIQKLKKYKDFCYDCFKQLNYKETKRWNTIIEKYGNKNEYIEKIKKTCIKKYNATNPAKNKKIREKIKKTCIKKYNVDNYAKTDEYKNKCKGISGLNNPEIKLKSKNTIREKYDREFFAQAHIPKNKLELSYNKDWLYHQHFNLEKSCSEIAFDLGIHQSVVNDRYKLFNMQVRRFQQSFPEKEIRNMLIENDINFDFNTRNIILPYELDIYIPNKNIAIEFNGLYWHSENKGKDKNYHKMKSELCKQKGIRLIQIFTDEWLKNKELVKKKLLHILGISQEQKIYARKCEIKTLQQQEKKEFFIKTHIQGDGPSSLNYGLFYENHLVAAIGFIKQANNEYILNRYSTNANVIGGFTKLLTYFERTLNPKKITTFADLRWSQGNLYEKSGFSLDKEIPPDYSYVQGQKRIHKFNFRHKQMKIKLKNYDKNLSEHENMLNNKIYRIYDAGKLRFIKKAH